MEGVAGRHEVVVAVIAPASVVMDATLAHLLDLELAGAAQDSVLRGLPLRRKELAAAVMSSACSAGGRRDREGRAGTGVRGRRRGYGRACGLEPPPADGTDEELHAVEWRCAELRGRRVDPDMDPTTAIGVRMSSAWWRWPELRGGCEEGVGDREGGGGGEAEARLSARAGSAAHRLWGRGGAGEHESPVGEEASGVSGDRMEREGRGREKMSMTRGPRRCWLV
jgi:hypothetical protein